MEVEVEPREWGNSLGITLPKDVVKKEKIRKGDKLVINIRKKRDLTSLRGLFKFRRSAQQIKDEMRKGWN